MERKTLKKKILGIFCTLCLCICMTNGTAVVYGAGVDSCVDRIVEARYANIAAYSTGLKLRFYICSHGVINAKVKASISTTMTCRDSQVRAGRM